MKNLKRVIIIAFVALVGVLPMSAQFAWGPKLGVTISSLKFDKEVFSSENRAGFTGGLTAEFMLPILNIGFDASLMYARLNGHGKADVQNGSISVNRNYFEIPVNVKWKIGLPIVGKIVTPYIFTGPSFGFLMGKKEINDLIKNKTCDIAWNIGAGVQLFTKLQIGASYAFGMTKSVIGIKDNNSLDVKNRYWTITAAYLF